MNAFGQALAIAWARVAQMPALTFLAIREVPTGQTYEEIISSHTWLSRNTSRDDDDVTALKSLLSSVVGGQETGDLGRGRDVREVGSDLIC